MSKFNTREEWLNFVAIEMLKVFDLGKKPKYRITCGWALGRSAKKTRGQCIYPVCSKDGTTELIISMKEDNPVDVAATLIHELIHAFAGPLAKHGPVFRKMAISCGLIGKMTTTLAGPDFISATKKLLMLAGKYPHAALDMNEGSIKQTTRMIKSSCEECGYTVRLSRKWIEKAGAPHCPHHGEMAIFPF